MITAVLLGVLLVVLGVAIGRLSITTQQRIVRVRQERHRWLLRAWQDDLERQEGLCQHCRALR